MSQTETLEAFYRDKMNLSPVNLNSSVGHFNVFRLEDCNAPNKTPLTYNRRDYYKISLIRGHVRYHYADKSVENSGTTLIFCNPMVPYTWEIASGDVTGVFCIFTESFFTEKIRGSLKELPMFSATGKP